MITGIIGFSLFFALRYLFQKKRNVEALGMGDVYLIAGLGVWLGFEKFLYILSISSFLGIFYYLLVGKKEENFEIPYGSALSIFFSIFDKVKFTSFIKLYGSESIVAKDSFASAISFISELLFLYL